MIANRQKSPHHITNRVKRCISVQAILSSLRACIYSMLAVPQNDPMAFRSDRRLGDDTARPGVVNYHIPGEDHLWEFMGHIANLVFQQRLGRDLN